MALSDINVAYQGFKVATSIDPAHSEALNNLAVLEGRRNQPDAAKTLYYMSIESNDNQFEGHFNLAVNAFRNGDFRNAHVHVSKVLQIYPDHEESKEMLSQLRRMFLSSMW